MKSSKEIIERIEGEAHLDLEWQEGRVAYAKIKFFNFRGVEQILQGRDPLDAIALSSRVCGVCCNAHALNATLTLENAYERIGEPLHLSNKAQSIRELVLMAERIQSHIKWFFCSILAEIAEDEVRFAPFKTFRGEAWLEAQKISMQIIKIAAIFGGQWPHSSFVMVGGVVSDPLRSDFLQCQTLLQQTKHFLEKHVGKLFTHDINRLKRFDELINSSELIELLHEYLLHEGYDTLGRSHNAFIKLSDTYLGAKSKYEKGKLSRVTLENVSESLANTFFEDTKGYTYSKSAKYQEKFFETGPLARMIIGKNPLVQDLYERYGDSTITRIFARLIELSKIIVHCEKLLKTINLQEPSFIAPKLDVRELTAQGVGVIEAARGSLYHKVEIEKGKIASYDIITPTVWNLGNGSKEEPSIAQKALIGLEDIKKADLIFKSFDVCAVCTTQ